MENLSAHRIGVLMPERKPPAISFHPENQAQVDALLAVVARSNLPKSKILRIAVERLLIDIKQHGIGILIPKE